MGPCQLEVNPRAAELTAGRRGEMMQCSFGKDYNQPSAGQLNKYG